MTLSRRSFLIGSIAALAAPAIVRAGSLMPVSAPKIVVPITVRIPAGNWSLEQVKDMIRAELRRNGESFADGPIWARGFPSHIEGGIRPIVLAGATL